MLNPSNAFTEITAWDNLLDAWRKAAKGKRGRESTARFEHRLADHLLELQDELESHRYRPGPYHHFYIHEPKQRRISAAPFRDRMVHPQEAQVTPVTAGIPWLGFIAYPDHRRIKARNVRHFSRRLRERWAAHCAGEISFAEFDASVQGWIEHVRDGDTWGLRRQLLDKPLRRTG